jgi:hypothetical protein
MGRVDATEHHAAKGPTVYRTLMEEAFKDARSAENLSLRPGNLDELLADNVPPALLESVKATVSGALYQVYQRGLQHGYQQAAEAFDNRNGDA